MEFLALAKSSPVTLGSRLAPWLRLKKKMASLGSCEVLAKHPTQDVSHVAWCLTLTQCSLCHCSYCAVCSWRSASSWPMSPAPAIANHASSYTQER